MKGVSAAESPHCSAFLICRKPLATFFRLQRFCPVLLMSPFTLSRVLLESVNVFGYIFIQLIACNRVGIQAVH